MFRKVLLFAVMMFSLASVAGLAAPDGPLPPDCYPCGGGGN